MITLEEGWKIVEFFMNGAVALIIAYGIWMLFNLMNKHNRK